MNRDNNIDWTSFDLSGLAGSEKFHTGMLGWILSGECYGLKEGAHNRILNELTGRIIDGDIVCIPESSPFDLLLRSDKFLVVVENKLSSTTSNDQIQKYSDRMLHKIDNETKQRYDKELQRFKGNREPIGILLSLADEKLAASEGGEYLNEKSFNTTHGEMIWKAVTYARLLELLLQETNNTDTVLQAYLRTLENLCKLLGEFLKDHTSFPYVFFNGNLKKTAKSAVSNDYEKYIIRNNLETGFQIALLREILFRVMKKLRRDGIVFQGTYVGETKGTGSLGISLMEIPKGREFLGFCFKEDFYLGFQYQGDALKVPFSKWEYKHSIINDFSDEKNERDAFFKRFKEVYTDIESLGYKRLNKPRSKAYVSVSLNMNPNAKHFKNERLPERLRDKLILCESRVEDFVSLIVDECRLITEISKREMDGDVDS